MQEQQLAESVPVRPAATVMLVRNGDAGVEVFMLRRSLSASFAHGQYVFPGGAVDDEDHGADLEAVCLGLDDAAASARYGMASGGLAWAVAAIRECFEEAGILLASDNGGESLVQFDTPEKEARFEAARIRIHNGEQPLESLCHAENLRLLVDRLELIDHWVTPVGERRRFDTRFFVTEAPTKQEPLHDDQETIDSLWVRPEIALERWKAGDLQMFPPTVACLQWLVPHVTTAEVMEAAAKVGVPVKQEPRLLFDDDGKFAGVLMVGDEGYDEIEVPKYVLGNHR